MSEQDMIQKLCTQHKNVTRLANPLQRSGIYFALNLLYIASFFIFIGVRDDFFDKITTDPSYIFELTIATLIWFSSICAAAWLCVPDERGQKWIKFIPLALLGILLIWMGIRMAREGLTHFMPETFMHCFESGLLMGFVPLALVAYMSRAGATTAPIWMAVMNAFAVGAAGWIGLRLTCGMDDVGHAFLTHFAPFVFIGTVLALLAHKIFRW